MKRKAVVTLTYFLVLMIGGVIGFAIGDRHGAAKLEPLSTFSVAMYAGFLTSSERLYASDIAYENSLRSYISLLDNLTTGDASGPTRPIYAADKALSLIRLADLVDKRGESAESTRLTSDALAVCSTSGLPFCSSAELRQRAQRIDALFKSTKQSK